ncbi:unnamed protein product [Citrullus colocynthis]|uniref:Uncharacterized protein n=1 Tax=Citrullus colocynthis TaxID=252529 RepID=A0ABP0YUA4_9ROSI
MVWRLNRSIFPPVGEGFSVQFSFFSLPFSPFSFFISPLNDRFPIGNLHLHLLRRISQLQLLPMDHL